MLVLEYLLPHLPYCSQDDFLFGVETGEKEIRSQRIDYQNSKAKEVEVGSNDIVRLLDGLVREYVRCMANLKPEYKRGYDQDVFVFTHPDYGL